MDHDGMAPQTFPGERLTAGQRTSVVLAIVGTVVCFPAALLFGLALGAYPFRMECTLETLGSGCYEGELELSGVLLALVFVPFFVATLVLAIVNRKSPRRAATWLPLIGLCSVTLIAVAVYAVLMATSPSPGL